MSRVRAAARGLWTWLMSSNDVVQFLHKPRAKLTFVFRCISHHLHFEEGKYVCSANNSVQLDLRPVRRI